MTTTRSDAALCSARQSSPLSCFLLRLNEKHLSLQKKTVTSHELSIFSAMHRVDRDLGGDPHGLSCERMTVDRQCVLLDGRRDYQLIHDPARHSCTAMFGALTQTSES